MTDKITAELRTEFGKGAARRIRRADKVPAVLYGHGAEPQHLSLPGHDTMLALKKGGSNALLTITIEGKDQLALAREVQSDPIKGFLEHIDFVAIKRGEKVIVDVPVVTVGEAVRGTVVTTPLGELRIEVDATKIPESIEVSVEDADAGFQVNAGELNLPDGAVLSGIEDDEAVVIVAHAPTAEQLDAELEQAEADAGIERDEPEVSEAE
ncbi:50S ribosomal protein L25/general stress protein Ctc [Nocardioides massiliensis]|uniref:Large ribosomal subunit protein bL25 n=1 Tax=Nocardioides massiliensis TaxID=1325935 RepID=A0ABT9NIL3_9ACTN|nr:50S ribosomal protein L25/general stress protein Ctc [Nocardioides massiliensis]MDP9820258.1 large subunit ribosomal protein L25 [Nocardioides massiliensis]